MAKLNFYCIDDEKDIVASIVASINKQTNKFKIVTEEPKPFSDQIATIRKWDSECRIDGLLLDLRLDQNISSGANVIDYRAGTLAQQIRTLATEGKLKAFPIFLWSINKKLSKSFIHDITSQDLFDQIIHKEDIPEKSKEIASQLTSIATGYSRIQTALAKDPAFWNILQIAKRDKSILDSRIGEEFLRKPKSTPVHSYANYILRKLILTPGPLIDELILCARLGLDRGKSKNTEKLFTILDSKCVYKGPFGDGWKRWWAPLVERWWSGLAKNIRPIGVLTAEERVTYLSDSLKLKGLVAADPIRADYGHYYSTVCQALKRPLDPIDGFVIATPGSEQWQDKLYLSREAALNRAKYDVTSDLDSFEQQRLLMVQQTHKKHGKKGS